MEQTYLGLPAVNVHNNQSAPHSRKSNRRNSFPVSFLFGVGIQRLQTFDLFTQSQLQTQTLYRLMLLSVEKRVVFRLWTKLSFLFLCTACLLAACIPASANASQPMAMLACGKCGVIRWDTLRSSSTMCKYMNMDSVAYIHALSVPTHCPPPCKDLPPFLSGIYGTCSSTSPVCIACWFYRFFLLLLIMSDTICAMEKGV